MTTQDETKNLNDRLNKMREGAMGGNKDWLEVYQDGLDYVFNNQASQMKVKEGWDPVVCNYIYPAMMQELAMESQRRSTIMAMPVEDGDSQDAEVWTKHLQWLFDEELKMADYLLRASLDRKIYGQCVAMVLWEPKKRWDDVNEQWIGGPQVKLIPPEYFGMDPEATDVNEAAYVVTQRRALKDWAKTRWPQHASAIESAKDSYDSWQKNTLSAYMADNMLRNVGAIEHKDDARLANLLTGMRSPSRVHETGDSRYITIEQFFFKDYEEVTEDQYAKIPEDRLLTEGSIYQREDENIYRDAKTDEPLTAESWPSEKVGKISRPKYPNGRFVLRIGDVILNEEPEDQIWQYSKWPFVIGPNHILPHTWHGLNVTEMALHPQDWINVTATHIGNYIKNFSDPVVVVGKNGVAEGTKLRNCAGAVWNVNDASKVKRESPPPMSSGTLEAFRLFTQETKDATGMQDVGLGRGSSGQQTAQEIIRLETNTRLRTALSNKHLDSFIIGIFERVGELCQRNYKVDDVIRVVGDKGSESAARISARMVDMDYDIRLEVGTSLPFDRERKKADMMALANIFGPAVWPQLLRAFDIENPEDILQNAEIWQQVQPIFDNPQLLQQFQLFLQTQGGINGQGEQAGQSDRQAGTQVAPGSEGNQVDQQRLENDRQPQPA